MQHCIIHVNPSESVSSLRYSSVHSVVPEVGDGAVDTPGIGAREGDTERFGGRTIMMLAPARGVLVSKPQVLRKPQVLCLEGDAAAGAVKSYYAMKAATTLQTEPLSNALVRGYLRSLIGCAGAVWVVCARAGRSATERDGGLVGRLDAGLLSVAAWVSGEEQLGGCKCHQ